MSDQIANGGLLHRRALLKSAGAGLAAGFLMPASAAEDWMTHPGQAAAEYGHTSRFSQLKREQVGGHAFGAEAGSSSTPLQALNGTITNTALRRFYLILQARSAPVSGD